MIVIKQNLYKQETYRKGLKGPHYMLEHYYYYYYYYYYFDRIRTSLLVVLKSHIAIFSTIYYKNRVALVESKPKNLDTQLQLQCTVTFSCTL